MKKRFFIIAFLVFIISLGCVSASDDLNDTSDVLAADEGSFTALQNMINSASEGSTINLKTDYAYDSSFEDTGIRINKTLTINGNNHIISGSESLRAFIVESDNVVLKNIKFVNGSMGNGGAIYFKGDNLLIDSCQFLDNTANNGGAIAIYLNGIAKADTFATTTIKNSLFERNSASGDGGAVYVGENGGTKLVIDNCIFTDNLAEDQGGAVFVPSAYATTLDIYNRGAYAYTVTTPFPNIIEIKGKSKFTDNLAYDGGAVMMEVTDSALQNNVCGILNIQNGVTFEGNTAKWGASLSLESVNSTISGASFINNNATSMGGAIYTYLLSNMLIDSSTFTDNTAKSVGGSIYATNNLNVTNSKFTTTDNIDFINYYVDSQGDYPNGKLYLENNEMTGNNDYDVWFKGNLPMEFETNLVFKTQTAAPGETIALVELQDDNENSIRIDDNITAKISQSSKIIDSPSLEFNETAGSYSYDCDLDVGVYSVTGSISSSIASNVKVKKATLTVKLPSTIEITAPDVTMNYGDSKNLQITLTEDDMPIANANVLINLNKVNYTQTTNNNGKISMPLKLNSGTYDAVISYEDASQTAQITVNKLATTLSLTAVQSGDKTATLTATLSPAEADGDVVFNINGKDYTAKINNGKATVSVNNLDYKTYDVKASYAGSTNYKASSASAKVIIEENQLIVKAADLVKYYSGAEKFTVRVTDSDGKAQSGKSVKISINGADYTQTTDSNGNAAINVDLKVGVYEATATCYGQTAKATVTIKSTVDGKDITKMYKNGTQYSVAFVDSKGNPLKNTDVEFNINGESYKRTTDNNGIAGMNINLNPGKYEITTKNPSTKEDHSNLITVKSVIVENYDLTKYFKNASQYKVRILDEVGKPVKAGVEVIFNINGVFYTRQTDNSGYAQLNINLEPGTYVITSYYNGLETSNTVKVQSVLSGKDVNMKFKDGTKYEIKLIDGKGNPYPGQNIILNINGIFYERKTDSEGIAKLNLNLEPGTYIITAYYNGLMQSNTIKIDNVLFGKDINMEYKDGTKYEVKLIDAKGNPYPGQKIILNINGVFYERVTESDGIARLNINLNPGTYIITASYNGLSRANKVVVNAVEEELIKYDCGNFYVSLPESATIELAEEDEKAAVFDVTYAGNTFKITGDGHGIYSANSYVNMVINAGGRVIDRYDGWTLTEFDSNYLSYKDHNKVVYGVLGPVRDVVESICGSIEFA